MNNKDTIFRKNQLLIRALAIQGAKANVRKAEHDLNTAKEQLAWLQGEKPKRKYRKRRKMSPEARKRISIAMRKHFAKAPKPTKA